MPISCNPLPLQALIRVINERLPPGVSPVPVDTRIDAVNINEVSLGCQLCCQTHSAAHSWPLHVAALHPRHLPCRKLSGMALLHSAPWATPVTTWALPPVPLVTFGAITSPIWTPWAMS